MTTLLLDHNYSKKCQTYYWTTHIANIDKYDNIIIDLNQFYSGSLANIGFFIKFLKDFKIKQLGIKSVTSYKFNILFNDLKIFFESYNFDSINLHIKNNDLNIILDKYSSIDDFPEMIYLNDFEFEREGLCDKLDKSMMTSGLDLEVKYLSIKEIYIDDLKSLEIEDETFLIISGVIYEMREISKFCHDNPLVKILKIENSILNIESLEYIFDLLSYDRIIFLDIVSATTKGIEKIKRFLIEKDKEELFKHVICLSESHIIYDIEEKLDMNVKKYHRLYYDIQKYVEHENSKR